MDKVQQEVYDRIKLHCEYAASAKVIPIQIMHGELLKFMAADKVPFSPEEINRALRALYNDGMVLAGPTVHGTYLTLPQYMEQVKRKTGYYGTTQEE